MSSADSAARRSVSCPRMCPMPVSRDGPSASAASAASTVTQFADVAQVGVQGPIDPVPRDGEAGRLEP